MIELTLEITNKCHQECAWCSTSATPNGKHADTEWLRHVLHRVAIECAPKGEPITVRFSGGEPTLHPDLGQLIDYASGLNYRIVLLTNGQQRSSTPASDRIKSPNRLAFMHPKINQYWVDIVNQRSIDATEYLRGNLWESSPRTVLGMHVVLAEGNRTNVWRAVRYAMRPTIFPVKLRLLVLQQQGRGADCQPIDWLTWTGDHGCQAKGKITVTPEGEVSSCSALKYGRCTLTGDCWNDKEPPRSVLSAIEAMREVGDVT